MKVERLETKFGNLSTNQIAIIDKDKVTFQSYTTKIAVLKNSTVTLGLYWDCSHTTIWYLYQFLRDYAHLDIHSKKDVFRYADEGKIKFTKRF